MGRYYDDDRRMRRYMRDDDMYMRDNYMRDNYMRDDGYVFAGMIQDYDDFWDGYDSPDRLRRQGVRGTGRYGIGGSRYPGRRYRRMDEYPEYNREYRRDDYPFDLALQEFLEGIEEMVPQKKEILDKWVKNMKNVDGSSGAHFTREQVEKQYDEEGLKQKDIHMEDYYAAINMIYSDYSAVLRDSGISTMKVYSDLAVAFLDDKDAGKNKILKYALVIPKQKREDD